MSVRVVAFGGTSPHLSQHSTVQITQGSCWDKGTMAGFELSPSDHSSFCH
jgi:hypothetical protein